MMSMTPNTPRRTRNDAAWRDPSNWSWRGPLGLYFSKDDSRLWVPKAVPALGWTLNLAHPAGAGLFLALMLASAMLLGAGIALAAH